MYVSQQRLQGWLDYEDSKKGIPLDHPDRFNLRRKYDEKEREKSRKESLERDPDNRPVTSEPENWDYTAIK